MLLPIPKTLNSLEFVINGSIPRYSHSLGIIFELIDTSSQPISKISFCDLKIFLS